MRFDQLERSLKSSFSAVRRDIEHVKHAQQKETSVHATYLKQLQEENTILKHSLAELKEQLEDAQRASSKLAENLNSVEDTFKKRIEVTLDELHAELQSKEQQKKQAKVIADLQRKWATFESLREHVERSSVDYRVLEHTFLSKQDFRDAQRKQEQFREQVIKQSVLKKDFQEQREVFSIQLQQMKTELEELEESYQELMKSTATFTLKKDHEQQVKQVTQQLQDLVNRLQALKETQQQFKQLAPEVDSLKKKHEAVNLQALQKEVQHLKTQIISKNDVLEELEKTNTSLQSLKQEVELVDEMHQTILDLKETSASKKEIDQELEQLNDRITQLMETIRKGVQEYTVTEPEMVAAQTTIAAKMTKHESSGVARKVGNAILDFFTEEVELEVNENQTQQRKEKDTVKSEKISLKANKKHEERKGKESEKQNKESWFKRVGKSFSHFFAQVVEDEDETVAEPKQRAKKAGKKPKASKKISVSPKEQIEKTKRFSEREAPKPEAKVQKKSANAKPVSGKETPKRQAKKEEKLPKGWKKVEKVKRVGKDDAPYYYQDDSP
ncbi:hypothetical protein HYW21_04425 [Candidatus Woesearchaeota archaeon]|nr:hypothetical protein [Candidatus Woesearchaeota archaeon]